jgi:polyisoprenoid-binding protein YceI
MNSTVTTLSLALALAAGAPALAHATEYKRIVAADSAIAFSYTQMGVTLEGGFDTFSGELHYDPARPESARAVIEVALASIRTGIAEADGEVQDRSWFHSAAFPSARFESTVVTPLGDERVEVAGTLTIKGTTRPVVVPATIRRSGDEAVFDGDFTIRRGDFAVGEGAWSKFDIVANDVRVRFRITAAAE